MKKIAVFLLLFCLALMPAQAEVMDEAQAYTEEQLLGYWHQIIALMREMEVYPYVELSEGDRGYEVMFLQARLAQLLYYGKEISPQFGKGTYAAMRMFERTHKLRVNGIASVEDQKLLFSSKALQNPGTPAGLDEGQTVPPDSGQWPDLEPPDWWTVFPKIPLVTPGPGFEIDPDILDNLDPGKFITPTPAPVTLNPINPDLGDLKTINPGFLITPTPAPVVTLKPNIPDLGGLKTIDPSLLITSTPSPIMTLNPNIPDLGNGILIDPNKLKTDLPIIKPGLDFPKP